jgi:uncharacterized protein DUF5681
VRIPKLGHNTIMSESKNSKKTGHRFKRGNKHGRGRPEGSRNRATIALQELLDGEGEAITRKAVEMAKRGDIAALRLCLERLLPPAKDRGIRISLPAVKSTADVMPALSALVQAVSNGDITPSEAQSLSGLLEAHRRTAETVSLEERISQLEKKVEDHK